MLSFSSAKTPGRDPLRTTPPLPRKGGSDRPPLRLVAPEVFSVGSLRWRTSGGMDAVTIVCKATFCLEPRVCVLCPDCEPVYEDDVRDGGDSSGRLLRPSDLVPFKTTVDLLVVGAHAGHGRVTRPVVARLEIGAIDKSVHVFGEGSSSAGAIGQELQSLFGDESLVLEHLHPVYDRLETRLPGLRPGAVLETSDGSAPIPLQADTLLIDAARGTCTVTWRGHIVLLTTDATAKVDISLIDPANSTTSWHRSTLRIADDTRPAVPEETADADPRDAPLETMELAPDWLSAVPRPAIPLGHDRGEAPAIESPWARRESPLPPPVVVAPVQVAPPAPLVVAPAAEVVELVWFETDSLPAFRRNPPWRSLLREGKRTPNDARDVARILTCADRISLGALPAALVAASSDGVFVPPWVLVEGELEPMFSPLAILRALLAALAPFPVMRPKVEQAREVLGSPGVEQSRRVVEAITQGLRRDVAEHPRVIDADDVERTTLSDLVERRSYDTRKIMGKECVRGLLRAEGDGEQAPAVVYVPDEAANLMPLARRWPARIIAELRSRADESEASPVALRAHAVGKLFRVDAAR